MSIGTQVAMLALLACAGLLAGCAGSDAGSGDEVPDVQHVEPVELKATVMQFIAIVRLGRHDVACRLLTAESREQMVARAGDRIDSSGRCPHAMRALEREGAFVTRVVENREIYGVIKKPSGEPAVVVDDYAGVLDKAYFGVIESGELRLEIRDDVYCCSAYL